MKKKSTSSTQFSIVTHCFWRYPIVGILVILAVVIIGLSAGSPDWPVATIKATATQQPGGTIWTVAQQLDENSSSHTNMNEYGMAEPAKRLVIDPIKSASWFLTAEQNQALQTYEKASSTQQLKWATNYDQAIKKTVMTSMNTGGEMGLTPVPKMSNISKLKGDFGPVPILAQTILQLAQKGYLETYFQGTSANNISQYINLWLYDQPSMLNTAVMDGLTDDQWGMIKERGFFVGPWYLIIPAIAHVWLPGGSNGPGFLFWNGIIAFFSIVLFPLVPGLRSIPKYLKLYKLIYAVDPNDAKSKGVNSRAKV